ncbi:MAG: SusD/RagB family nutrient-binding outer membrane lipoprotein [Flavisolibacter sp.]
MKKIYLIMLLAASFATGCNKFDSEINRNPNQPSQASAAQLLANAMLSLPGLSSSPQGEFMAQYLAETQYVGASLYPEGSTSFYGWYTGPLMNIETVLTATDLSPMPTANQLAVARILKAYYFWNITDRWGDVPFTQSLKGQEDFTPEYDTQESIYNALFQMLDEANAMIVAGNIPSDIVYNGDMTKWKKFGNTIHMLMALRLSEVNAQKGNTEFNKAMNNGIMTSNADNFVFKHLVDANNQNYWYGQVVAQSREWWALTETLVDYMKPLNDPRLPVYGKPALSGGGYFGLEFGTQVGIPNTQTVSLLGTAIYAQNAPVYLVTYAQALFAMAEAAKRGWIPGGDVTATTHYNMAIEQSFRQWTGGTTGLATYMTNVEVIYNPTRAIEQISNQRYVHLFMHGYEAWAEWRRTGYPNNLVQPGGKAVPLRLGYPDNEAFNNADNYNAALQRQFGGVNTQYGKVWWDKP